MPLRSAALEKVEHYLVGAWALGNARALTEIRLALILVPCNPDECLFDPNIPFPLSSAATSAAAESGSSDHSKASGVITNSMTRSPRLSVQTVRVVVATSPTTSSYRSQRRRADSRDRAGQLDPVFQGSGIRHPGLVLGLFIASEIARAHGGSLVVDSTTKETRFSFLMTLESVAARHGTFLLADG
ncbi:hypothetical protein X741_33545 [Mesorhizobium sp. LNHC229A00]|nr:hypothetical protein X741_33545 [Mesorhizobium sp. LNHC229A00]